MSKIDTNVDNYTDTELATILNLDIDTITQEEVDQTCESFIARFDDENNSTMSQFFSDIQTQLTQHLQQKEGEKEPDQTEQWITHQALPQKNKNQKNKNTDRKQKIDVYNNAQMPMNKEQLGVSNNFLVPVAQDSLNPNLTNTIKRFINLDSRYRPISNNDNGVGSTDYTIELTEPLKNVLNLKLYSIQLPYSWYTINNSSINQFTISFFALDGSAIIFIDKYGEPYTGIPIIIQPGSYTAVSLTSSLNAAFLVAGFISSTIITSYNTSNGKITINLLNAVYTDPFTFKTYTVDTTTIITFFDIYNTDFNCLVGTGNAINNTIGWILGYRVTSMNVNNGGNIADAIVDLYGPKYIIFTLDDYRQNHINSGLIGITEQTKTLKLPSYYNPSMVSNCSNNIPQVSPQFPRNLTNAQIYSINEILKNNETNPKYRLSCPTNTGTFAIIPIKNGGLNFGDVYVEFSGSLQDNKRIYFGPVDIDKLHIQLLDDKGNILNLNGLDWTCTLIAEILYQY
jgi:hypothetical protein